MFEINTKKMPVQEYNLNKLIIKSSKEAVLEKSIKPKQQKTYIQQINTTMQDGTTEVLFEIY